MTIAELKIIQQKVDQKVKDCYECERISGRSSYQDACPVYDGIADEEMYLNSPVKIGWVLKEPYDDWDANGNPVGGEWSLVKDCFLDHDANWEKWENGCLKKRQWTNRVWQVITYVMYGYSHDRRWGDMPKIRNCRPMMDVIKGIAWINVSKMPAKTSSSDSCVKRKYQEEWKSVVDFQIENLGLDVLVFGRTFHCFSATYNKIDCVYKNDWCSCYVANGMYLIDTYHPGRKGSAYVNAVIDALNYVKDDLNKKRGSNVA